MTEATEIVVAAAGGVCSVGLDLASAEAAIRARLSNFRHSHFVDDLSQLVQCARVPLDGTAQSMGSEIVGGAAKVEQMLLLAIDECLSSGPEHGDDKLPLLLLGRHEQASGAIDATAVLARNRSRFGDDSEVVHGGRTALVAAVERARELLDGDAPAVLVAAADSLLTSADINDALELGRLRTTSNADGFIPGEAAACVMLVKRAKLPRDHGGALRIMGMATAQEQNERAGEKVNVGRGMADAIGQALAAAGKGAHDIDRRYVDCSGESYFFQESTYAWGRVLRKSSPADFRMEVLASSIGEVGVAVGPLTLAIMMRRARRGQPSPRLNLLQLSENSTECAALVVETL